MNVKVQRLSGNLFEVRADGHAILVSFETPVAMQDDEGRVMRTNIRYSRSTERQLSEWLFGRNPARLVNQEVLDHYLTLAIGDKRLRGLATSIRNPGFGPVIDTEKINYREYTAEQGDANLVVKPRRRYARH